MTTLLLASNCAEPVDAVGTRCMEILAEDDYLAAARGGRSMGGNLWADDVLALAKASFAQKSFTEAERNACNQKLMEFSRSSFDTCPSAKTDLKASVEQAMVAHSAKLRQRLAAFRSDSGHGKSRWGMSRRQVLRLVDGLSGDEDQLSKNAAVAGFPVRVTCLFVEDRLVMVSMQLRNTHVGSQRYIEDFQRLSKILRKKYGAPSYEDIEWDSEFRAMMGDDLLAANVLAGHAKLVARWLHDDTRVMAICSADNLKIRNAVRYVSVDLMEWADEKLTAADAQGL